MIAYHVDRANRLKVGQTINLITPSVNNAPQYFLDNLKELYDCKLSFHGEQYALNKYSDDCAGHILEQILEVVRIYQFPNKVSRFQSFFAFENLNDAINFSENQYPIYKIEFDHDCFHKGDINLLYGSTILQSFNKCISYWKGESSETPCYELLIKPPVKIIDTFKN